MNETTKKDRGKGESFQGEKNNTGDDHTLRTRGFERTGQDGRQQSRGGNKKRNLGRGERGEGKA